MSKDHRSKGNKVVAISMSRELHEKIKAYCKKKERDFSGWVRDLVIAELEKPEKKKAGDEPVHFRMPARNGAGMSRFGLRK